ncbi:hypothetical protein YC2023_065500 [Brassica napus]
MNRRRQLASSPASIISAAIIFGVDHLGCHYLRRRSYRPSLSSVLIILSVIISSAAHPHRYHHHFNHRIFFQVRIGSMPVPVSGCSDQFLVLPETSCRGNYQR